MIKKPLVKSILKKLWYLCAFALITLAVLSSAMRAMTPLVAQYKPQIEARLSERIQQKVSIQDLTTDWNWFEPVIRLNQVLIGTEVQSQIKIKQIVMGIDLFDSVWQQQIQPGTLTVSGANLTLSQHSNQWSLNHVLDYQPNFTAQSNTTLQDLASWFLRQDNFKLSSVNLRLILQNGTIIPLDDLTIRLQRDGDHHKLKAQFDVKQTSSSKVKLSALFDAKDDSLNAIDGDFHIRVNRLVLSQWLNSVLTYPYQVNSGWFSGDFWFRLRKGNLVRIQTLPQFKQASVTNRITNKQLLVSKLQGNFSWYKQNKGWMLEADDINYRVGGETYTDRKLRIIKKNKAKELYLNTIDANIINKLMSLGLMNKGKKFNQLIEKWQFAGLLSNVNMLWRGNEVISFSTGFDKVAISKTDKTNMIKNISGAFAYKFNKALLTLASQQLTIHLDKSKPILLDKLQGVFRFKQRSQGWQVMAEDVLVKNKNLTLSSQFNWNEIEKGKNSHLNLMAKFSVKNAQELKRFIPFEHLKPKLAKWFKQAIVEIGSVAGRVALKGKLADFPFDNQSGEFKLDSHLSAVNLRYAPGWPEAENIDARLSIDSRVLSLELKQATLADIPINKLNLSIPNLGLDKEVLYLHGQAQTSTEKGIATLHKSPLARFFTPFKQINVNGRAKLDLKLQIPLNPFDDDDLAIGSVVIIDNNLNSQKWFNLKLNKLNGTIYFDQNGLKPSMLKAVLFDLPVAIKLNSMNKPEKATSIQLTGQVNINSLQQTFKQAIFSVMKGIMPYELNLVITQRKDDLDTLTLSSNLKGVQIALPQPLGKELNQVKELVIKHKFSMQRKVIVWMNYAHNFSAVLQFLAGVNGYRIDRGEIRFGSKKPLMPKRSMVRIIGSINSINLIEWIQVLNDLSDKDSSSSPLNKLRYVDVLIGKLTVFSHQFDNIKAKLIKQLNSSWLAQVSADAIAGEIRLNLPKTVSADLSKLRLNLDKAKTYSHHKASIDSMPELTLTIDDLVINKIKLGQLKLNSSKLPGKYSIDNLDLRSTNLALTSHAVWSQHDKKNQFKLKGQVNTNDLANLLRTWHVEPVIAAKKGGLNFEVSWPDTPWNIALKSMKGKAQLNLINGRITHLDKETESKLGLGKLLSILSLQTLPRRLVLDFSDLAYKGYSFDKFKGDFTLKKGWLNTSKSFLDGPVAYVSMSGGLDLLNRQYDLTLKVSPHITASLPVVATIAGGPVAGVATWVASKIINQSMRKVSSYTYAISGPWYEPIVQQVSISH